MRGPSGETSAPEAVCGSVLEKRARSRFSQSGIRD